MKYIYPHSLFRCFFQVVHLHLVQFSIQKLFSVFSIFVIFGVFFLNFVGIMTDNTPQSGGGLTSSHLFTLKHSSQSNPLVLVVGRNFQPCFSAMITINNIFITVFVIIIYVKFLKCSLKGVCQVHNSLHIPIPCL